MGKNNKKHWYGNKNNHQNNKSNVQKNQSVKPQAAQQVQKQEPVDDELKKLMSMIDLINSYTVKEIMIERKLKRHKDKGFFIVIEKDLKLIYSGNKIREFEVLKKVDKEDLEYWMNNQLSKCKEFFEKNKK
jgi:hypothetical protein